MSIAVFGIYGVLIVLCYRNEVVHISFNNGYMVLVGLIILAIWNEVHFYFCHRLMHTKLFLKIHQTHHKSHVVTPFSTYSFHPIESLIFGSVMILPMLLIDFEAMALLIFPIYHLFFNTLGHSNVKLKNLILEEFKSGQGTTVDLGGYYLPNAEKVESIMRPSKTFNQIIASVLEL